MAAGFGSQTLLCLSADLWVVLDVNANPPQVSQPSDLNGEFGLGMKRKDFGLSFGQTATDFTVLLFLLQLLTHPYPNADISLAHRPLVGSTCSCQPCTHTDFKSYLMNNYQGTGTFNLPDNSTHLREWNNISRLDTNARNTKMSRFTPRVSHCKPQTWHEETGRRKSAL